LEEDLSQGNFVINIASDIESIERARIGKAIEAMIRVVYNDMSEEAGLYFITELKEFAGDRITSALIDCEIDLDQVQMEQHYAYRRRERKKALEEAIQQGKTDLSKENLLGYTWQNVSFWKHQQGSSYCTLYDKKGNVVDRLNLDRIIQNYVDRLSGHPDMGPEDLAKNVSLYEKEYELLKLMLNRDMDAETAAHLLHVSDNELKDMISKLSQMEMLQYVSHDTLEITDEGISYLSRKKQTNKNH